MDILGCVVEVISGLTFENYLQKYIFDPLNMTSTGFSVDSSEKRSFTTLYTSGAFSRDGEIVGPQGLNPRDLMFSKDLRSIDLFDKSPYLSQSKLFDGGSGLVSNIDDYSKFSEMLLNDGELNGIRILSKASVALMSRNHLGIIDQTGFFDLDGLGFGLTVGVVEDAGLAGSIGSDGEFFLGRSSKYCFLGRS